MATCRVGPATFVGNWSGEHSPVPGAKVVVGVRAERLRLAGEAPDQDDVNMLPCRLGSAIYKGKYLDRTASTAIGELKIRLWESHHAGENEAIAWWKHQDCMVTSP